MSSGLQDLKQAPRFIAVEGPIGVGKTSLTKRLAETFNYELLLENAEENPFLDRFYQNPRQHALATQLFFLFQRAQQIADSRQSDLFEPVRVSDFLIDKDRLFAELNLEKDEYELYHKVYQHLVIDAPKPDLVIYLQAPTEVLLQRIQKRGIPSEQMIESEYLNHPSHLLHLASLSRALGSYEYANSKQACHLDNTAKNQRSRPEIRVPDGIRCLLCRYCQ
jgi:deoxyguanosine kinase